MYWKQICSKERSRFSDKVQLRYIINLKVSKFCQYVWNIRDQEPYNALQYTINGREEYLNPRQWS